MTKLKALPRPHLTRRPAAPNRHRKHGLGVDHVLGHLAAVDVRWWRLDEVYRLSIRVRKLGRLQAARCVVGNLGDTGAAIKPDH